MSQVYDGNSGAHLGEFQDTRSFGASIWEFFHPTTVQREYEAVGKEAPSIGDIMEGAADDAITATRETAHNVGEVGTNWMHWLVVGLVAYAAIKALDRVPSQGHVKRYARKQIKRARRAVAKRIR